MVGLYDYAYSFGVQVVVEVFGYVVCHAFLYLEALCVGFYESGEFGDAYDAPCWSGYVANSGCSGKRQHVMFA